mgnify:CR=1 FL=1
MQKENGYPDITAYEVEDLDRQIDNPMLQEIREIVDRFSAGGAARASTFLLMERESLTREYAFAIPTAGTLRSVACFSPLVEVGAGSGYWASCLTASGADVIAYDLFPPGTGVPGDISHSNWHFRKSWHDVRTGDESSAALHPDRSLFLCWPPPESPMALRAVESYQRAGGKTVLLLGQMRPLSMGSAELYELLKGFPVIERRRVPGWPGYTEELLVCNCTP